ncbi:MAG: type IV pili methyl-accepting chemotaxis transducer N-terminal domain-containing protein, partial [Haemophilus parainfluenzae]|nr:type IV pili methyl-accepting chemotaxis transducer N-terminal domain-containing protein [Haemophilus parainfluenzae]
MYAKRSVSTRIAKYLFVVIIFMGIISSLSLLVMASNKSDAEAINISGSLRMQSYRLLTEMERSPDTVEQNLVRYQRSLNAEALLSVQNQLFAPSGVRESYQKILQRWAVMSDFARAHQIEKYHAELKSYVQDVDDFVLELQRFAEQKWISAVSVLCVSMLLILAMVSYVIWYLKREVVKPLELMTKASMQVQMGQFKHIQLDTESNNELGILAKVFTQMSSELGRLYSRLEDAVNEQTQKLRQTNRSLTTLYQSSQLLTPTKINDKILSQVLNHIRVSEHLRYIELE